MDNLKKVPSDIFGLISLLVGIIGLLSFISGLIGPAGRFIEDFLSTLFGEGKWIAPFYFLSIFFKIIGDNHLRNKNDGSESISNTKFFIGSLLILTALSSYADIFQGTNSAGANVEILKKTGGYLGAIVGSTLASVFGTVGSSLIVGVFTIIGFLLISGATLTAIYSSLRNKMNATVNEKDTQKIVKAPKRQRAVVSVDKDEREPLTGDFLMQDDEMEDKLLVVAEITEEKLNFVDEPVTKGEQLSFELIDSEKTKWKRPSTKLLDRSKNGKLDEESIKHGGLALVAALEAHNVSVTLVGSTVGPTVTRYEIELAPGVKVAKVTSLSRDIAYALASPDVRILAPIPGKSAIGVEVPNRVRQLVTLGDLMDSPEFKRSIHPLDVPFGRDIAGRTVMVNLGEMPHLLIAGATGAGKSSAINSIITALLFKATPEDIRLILVDPKRVELGQYNSLPHLLTEVVVNPKKAAGALAWAVKEMERRYDLLAELGMRDITSYHSAIKNGEFYENDSLASSVANEAEGNELTENDMDELGESNIDQSQPAVSPEANKNRLENLPYIVIIVDELNDLMMVAARDVEESICRIAQMARAVGIHLVIATQRPSVDVITGVIKANIPSRLAFSVSSLQDSRVILDQAGAERLIGRGDMLLLSASSSIPRRIQGPWVSEKEVHAVVAHWKRQSSPAFVEDLDGESSNFNREQIGEDDELFQSAMELVVRSQLGSTSMLQRKLRVGFARAGRLMDLLENRGVVGPSEGSKARTVLMSIDELEEMLEN